MPRNIRDRIWRYVKPFQDSALLYGFKSGADTALAGALGQTDITAATQVMNLVLEPNNFKPYKIKKETAAGTEESFANFDKVASARQNNLIVSKAGYRPKTKRSNARGSIVYVTVNGIKYGWKFLQTSLPIQAGVIGHQPATGTETDIVFGATFPKPPRMKFVSANREDTLTTFVDPSKVDAALQAGWLMVDEGDYTAEHLKKYIG